MSSQKINIFLYVTALTDEEVLDALTTLKLDTSGTTQHQRYTLMLYKIANMPDEDEEPPVSVSSSTAPSGPIVSQHQFVPVCTTGASTFTFRDNSQQLPAQYSVVISTEYNLDYITPAFQSFPMQQAHNHGTYPTYSVFTAQQYNNTNYIPVVTTTSSATPTTQTVTLTGTQIRKTTVEVPKFLVSAREPQNVDLISFEPVPINDCKSSPQNIDSIIYIESPTLLDTFNSDATPCIPFTDQASLSPDPETITVLDSSLPPITVVTTTSTSVVTSAPVYFRADDLHYQSLIINSSGIWPKLFTDEAFINYMVAKSVCKKRIPSTLPPPEPPPISLLTSFPCLTSS